MSVDELVFDEQTWNLKICSHTIPAIRLCLGSIKFRTNANAIKEAFAAGWIANVAKI